MRLLERLLRLILPQTSLPEVQEPTDAPLPHPPVVPARDDEKVYEVKAGDTLESIARHVYGDAAQAGRIARANRHRLGDPPVLYPGLTLDLP